MPGGGASASQRIPSASTSHVGVPSSSAEPSPLAFAVALDSPCIARPRASRNWRIRFPCSGGESPLEAAMGDSKGISLVLRVRVVVICLGILQIPQ